MPFKLKASTVRLFGFDFDSGLNFFLGNDQNCNPCFETSPKYATFEIFKNQTTKKAGEIRRNSEFNRAIKYES